MATYQTLRRLVYFAAIAEAGSIRGAAQRLNLSVPVLSEALSELEAELGVSLATRSTRRFALTEAGVDAHAAARQILDTAQGLSDRTAMPRPLTGPFGLTVPVELADFWLPGKIKTFSALHPELVFDITVTDAVIDLQAGAIELAIRADYVPPGAPGAPGRAAAVGAEGRVPIPLIDSRLDRKLVATAPDGTKLPLHFTQTLRVTSKAASLALVRAGVGAALVMRGSVEAELARGDLAELLPGAEFGSIELRAVFSDRMPGQAAKAFAASLGLDGG